MEFIGGLLNVLIVVCSIFLICIVLIQRGRGGGLAGAFGGLGGSSAFGTKAGDVFTRVTVVTAGIWFVLAMALVIVSNRGQTSAFDVGPALGTTRQVAPTDAGAVPPPSASGSTSTPATAPSAADATSDELGLPAALTDDAPDDTSSAADTSAPDSNP